ncbi:hypothetical protein AU374_03324 [Cupriavidus metallidurans]|nr:hypothetical protein AU374_03324 [Cupriavidus metallidurans]
MNSIGKRGKERLDLAIERSSPAAVKTLKGHYLDQERGLHRLQIAVLGIVVPVLHHAHETFPLIAIGLVRCGRLVLMDLRVRLDPLSGRRIGDLILVAGIECGHRIHADHPVVRVVLRVDVNTEIHVDRARLFAHGRRTVFLHQCRVEIIQHYRCGLAVVMLLRVLQHEEDVDILERLRLRVSSIGTGQEAARNAELGLQVVPHFVLALRGILLFAFVEFQTRLELAKSFIDRQHQRCLQYPA